MGWLLLPSAAGIYFNVENASAAEERYRDFVAWTTESHLRWDAVALDFEPLCRLSRQLSSRHNLARFLGRATTRALARAKYRRASALYGQVVNDVHDRGWAVESYVLSIVDDDRRAGADLLHRMSGTPSVQVDLETLMVYTSFERRLGPALLTDYAKNAQSVAVGVTGAPKGAPRLGWGELERDLRLAPLHWPNVSVHSLDGCVEHGMLERLADVDWASEPSTRAVPRALVASLRCSVAAGLRGATAARGVLGGSR